VRTYKKPNSFVVPYSGPFKLQNGIK